MSLTSDGIQGEKFPSDENLFQKNDGNAALVIPMDEYENIFKDFHIAPNPKHFGVEKKGLALASF